MTDNEIIKALESASEWFKEHGRNTNTAIVGICDRAVDLINRQKAEIERLTKANERFAEEFDSYYAHVKSEAIKEFAERLCEGRVSNDPVVIAVKVELEEMTVNYESSKQRNGDERK